MDLSHLSIKDLGQRFAAYKVYTSTLSAEVGEPLEAEVKRRVLASGLDLRGPGLPTVTITGGEWVPQVKDDAALAAYVADIAPTEVTRSVPESVLDSLAVCESAHEAVKVLRDRTQARVAPAFVRTFLGSLERVGSEYVDPRTGEVVPGVVAVQTPQGTRAAALSAKAKEAAAQWLEDRGFYGVGPLALPPAPEAEAEVVIEGEAL